MNRFIKQLFFNVMFLTVIVSTQAQTSNQKIVTKLDNGNYLQIQVCDVNIFRVRLESKNEFSESLMERYGILKTDWEIISPKTISSSTSVEVQSGTYSLIINKKTGELTVKDKNNKIQLNKINLLDGTNEVSKNLGISLDKYFGKAKRGGGIIGDVDYTGKQTEFEEVGETKNSSVYSISLKADERFYGGGNTSRTNIQHRGTALRMWATYQKTEIPSPFLMSSDGWGIFNNTTAKNYFDVGRFDNDKLLIYNTDGSVDFYLMFGNSMPSVLKSFITITGKPYLLPKWAYGLAFGGNTMQNQFDVLDDAVRFREEKIPVDIFWIEPQWMAKYYDYSTKKRWNQNSFMGEPSWNEPYYPKEEGNTLFVSKLHNLGFKLALWLCIDHDLSIEEEDHIAIKEGKKPSGQEHWFDHLTKFMDNGVDGFKLDPGRTLDEHPDRVYFNGQTDKTMHNLSQVLLPKQMYNTFREHKGIRSFHHYCGGYAGAQHWSASTSGDNGGGKNALFDQLNLGLSGFLNTSADVLEGVEDNKAGLHLGFLLPWVQINSWYSMHQPWYMKPIEKETFRYYAQLRNALFPYIYSAAIEGSETGMPILRAMPLMFPNDRKVDNIIYQYMFGQNLLVNVFSDSIYLPEGNWVNFWNGQKMKGGNVVHAKIPDNRGGLIFVKSGSITPFQLPTQYIGEKTLDTLLLKVFPENKCEYTLYEDDGVSFEYETGKRASTLFECEQTGKSTLITIHPTRGNYKGKPSSRTYIFEVVLAEKPKKISVNGAKTNLWKFEDGIMKISVNQDNTSTKQTIVIL
ncbi:MAG: glycoside hydrolase family 31 protein [Paludibacter sp.]|nr:glycoside hydrolase family 31 protein [Paludibacter sp.]